MAKRKPIARVILGCLLTVGLVNAGSAEDFFAGKTVRIIVGTSAGGGFDLYARAAARRMSKYVPGNPNFIVVNMPGAGSSTAANHLYNLAKPDGLTMGTFIGHIVLEQIFNPSGVRFDARQFRWLGIPAPRTGACALTKASGITDLESWKTAKQPVPLGALAVGTVGYNQPKILKDFAGLPIQIVSGYRGSAEIQLAAERGELAGACWQWDSMKAVWRDRLNAGEVLVVLQFGQEPHPDLPKVPLATSLMKTDEARTLLKSAVENLNAITTVYALPPQTPEDRVEILRKAFMAVMRDHEFLADTEKLNLDVRPVGGEDTERMVGEYFNLAPDLREKLRKLIHDK